MIRRAALAAVLLAFAADAQAVAPDHWAEVPLEARFAEIARTVHGRVGICAMRVESTHHASLNADREFLMQSAFKALVAGAVLDAVDRDELVLEERVPLRPGDMSPGASALTDAHPTGGIAPSVHELLDLMITTSDNTACDALLRELGGPSFVTFWLDYQGISGVHVERDEFALGNDWYGLAVAPDTARTAARLRALRDAVPAARRDSAAAAFLADPRDRATPAAYADFLVKLQRRELLSARSTDTLLAMLGRCATGPNRLRAGLPPQAKLAHKTGTGGTWKGGTNAVNDAGIITLPGSGGHVVLVVFIEDLHGPVADAERAMAQIARAVFDHWNAPE